MQLKPPSIWFTIFCATVAVTCFALAYWQHWRAGVKQALQDQAIAQMQASPLDLNQVDQARTDLTWRLASAVGTYLDEQLLIDNRIHEHQVGFHVITPLQLDDQRVVLVNRGWLKAPLQRNQVTAPQPPTGQIAVAGLLAPDDSDAFELGADHGDNNIWQQLKISRWAKQNNQEVIPAVLLLNLTTEELVPVAKVPDFRPQSSRGYRLQWLAFGLIAIVGWLVVSLKKKP